MADEALLALSTFPDAETARGIAHTLVSEKLAACANIIPAMNSIYRWKGKIEAGGRNDCSVQDNERSLRGVPGEIAFAASLRTP